MYIFCIIMICIASILLILAVLVQSPKSGMAANFGAANQTMGVRQTTDFLEKFTWAMVAAIVFFSLLSTTALPDRVESKSDDTTNAAIENVEFEEPAADAGQVTEEATDVVPEISKENENLKVVEAPEVSETTEATEATDAPAE